MKQKAYRGLGIYFFLLIIGIVLYYIISNSGAEIYTAYSNDNLKDELKKGLVAEVEIQQNSEIPTGTVYVTYDDGSQIVFYTADVKDTQKICEDHAKDDVTVQLDDVKRPSLFQKLAPYIFAVILALIILMVIMGQSASAGGNSKLMTFGNSRAKKDVHTGIKFKDVAGLVEEKEDLSEVVDFLKNPAKYNNMGARIPKGILLVGPPGTGKTLLAKAVSGEADVPFFSISGSDFVEMFVGVGASRVRDLFDQARKMAPSIIFIDEIDAVGRHRGAGLGGGNDEREQTLNQILVGMDGFTKNEGIIVMAATNRRDILDPALMRPGRFDRQVTVNYPDLDGRIAILKVHARGKHLDEKVDLENIAKRTPYATGADLENILNEAAILAARANQTVITQDMLTEAIAKVQMGPEKKSHKVSEEDKRMVAIHESGHAVVGHYLPGGDEVHLITIVPRGQAAGHTLSLPSKERDNLSRSQLLDQICMILGGHAAENVMIGEIFTGASSDLKRATEICRRMVTEFGMSERIGTIYLSSEQEIFVGRDFAQSREYSEAVAAEVDAEVRRILNECYDRTKAVISEHREQINALVEALLKDETVTRSEFLEIMNGEAAQQGSLPEQTTETAEDAAEKAAEV